jgi:hypothetical protein
MIKRSPVENGEKPAVAAPEQSAEAPALRAFTSTRPSPPGTVEEALRLQTGAALKRAVGEEMIRTGRDPLGGRFDLAEADELEAASASFLDIETHVTDPQKAGHGGELVVATQEAFVNASGLLNTVHGSPDMLNATASRDRLELASAAGALTLGVDAAETIRARNSLEKMLAHQMAAAHSLAMTFVARAADLMRRPDFFATNQLWVPANQVLSVEASRLATTAARLMGAYQDGWMAQERCRRGGKQTVKVVHVHQHVAVGPGAQAVVAGSMKTGGRKKPNTQGRRTRNGR